MFTAALFTRQETICLLYIHIYTHIHAEEWILAICNNMDGPWGYYANWNKSDRERQIPYDLIIMWNLKKIKTHRYREQIGGYQKWRVGEVGKMHQGSPKVPTSSCKIDKSWGYNVQHGD